MPNTLHIARIASSPVDSPDILEWIDDPADVGIRWALPGGLQKLEVRVKARNRFDRYNRYQNHQGQRIAVFDNNIDVAVAIGWVYEIELVSDGVIYKCAGSWKRHTQLLDTQIFTQSDTVTAVIQSVLTNSVEVLDADQTNIATNTTAIGGWQPARIGGTYPADIIKELILFSDGTNQRYDYWTQPFNIGVRIRGDIAYYQPRTINAPADWVVSLSDLRRLDLSRNIWSMVTDLDVSYGYITGTHDGGNNSPTLIDTGADFPISGVTIGDSIYNITDGSTGRAAAVATTTITAPLTGGIDNDWDNGDFYSIRLRNSQDNTVTASETPILWQVDAYQNQSRMTQTQAQQYADTFVAEHNQRVQQQAFTITAPRIRSRFGVRWPLWELIKRGGGYIRIDDINPVANQFSERLDRLQSFRIVALDYRYRNNSLRVALDNQDSRLDVLLQAAKVSTGQVIGAI